MCASYDQPLRHVLAKQFAANGRDPALAEEISQNIRLHFVDEDWQPLRQFDPEQASLLTFLLRLARGQRPGRKG